MNWLPVEVTAGPASEPLSVADATVHVKADASDAEDQAYILALTKAARAHVESWTGLKLVSQTVKCRADCFWDRMTLPVAPVSAVTGITYLDGAGASQTLSTDIYSTALYGLAPLVYRQTNQSWPSTFRSPAAVTITATVGYSTLPEEIGHALKLLVATWYDQRSGVSDKPLIEAAHAVASLLTNFRIFRGA